MKTIAAIFSSQRRLLSWRLATTALASGLLAAAAADRLFADVFVRPLARDESIVIRFHGAAPLRRVLGGGVDVVRLALNDARGEFVLGKTLVDRSTNRAVVVRPEALREYFLVVEDMRSSDADLKASRLLARVERTGNLKPLDAIDARLRAVFGPQAGTRLDDPRTTAFMPVPTAEFTAETVLRQFIAGDDARWRSYLIDGDIGAFDQLRESVAERFHHAVDPHTGLLDAMSVLRRREHRRPLMRRTRNLLTFAAEIPSRSDLSDAAYESGATYDVQVARGLRPLVRDVLPVGGGVLRFVKGLASFAASPDTGDGGTFLGDKGGVAEPLAAPRLVNMTPPVGEPFLDLTTDWEDPDNQFAVPVKDRRPFVVRMRFSSPLDPRTVDPAHFTLTKVAVLDGLGNSTPVSVPVTVGVTLSQRRMGEIRVEIRPVTIPDPKSLYRVRVEGTVKGLDGAPLGAPIVLDL